MSCPPTSPPPADAFGHLRENADPEFYPGTDRQIITTHPFEVEHPSGTRDEWDAYPRKYTVRGQTIEFFTIGAVAKALRRKATTIRRWENEGTIPLSLWRSPSEDYHGKQRLYSRAQIEAMIQIATEEGVLDPYGRNIRSSRFRERVYELFVRTAAAEAAAAKARR